MLFNGIPHSGFCYWIPYGTGTIEQMQNDMNRVYDSGDISMTQIDSSTLRVVINGYKFNGLYPNIKVVIKQVHQSSNMIKMWGVLLQMNFKFLYRIIKQI